MQDLIFRELWGRGLRCNHCIELVTGRQGVKRDTPEIIAISKLRVERRGIADLIRDLEAGTAPSETRSRASRWSPGSGTSWCSSNGDDFDTVRNAVLNDLPQVPGILESDTLFTDGAYRTCWRGSRFTPDPAPRSRLRIRALGSSHARLPTMR